MNEQVIQNIINDWRSRMNAKHPIDYKVALSECIYELQSIMNPPIEEDNYWQEIYNSLPPITVIDENNG